MAAPTMKDLLEAGVHFGSLTHTWNPRMKPFIHGKRNKIHIINLVHTVRGLAKAGHFLREVAATGRQIVYVGTKRHMQGIIQQEALRGEMPCVTERWLGGTLTNFKTVRSRLSRLEELEASESSGAMAQLSKKTQSMHMRELRRMRKNLSGLRLLNRIPGALLVIDPRREHIAVSEARRVGVPVVALLDTDCDPAEVDIAVPSNDDSIRSVSLLLARLTDSVVEGVQRFKGSGRAPEDALGVRASGDEAHDRTAHDMLASSGLAARKAAASAPEPGAPEPGAPEPGAPEPGAPAATETVTES